MPVHVWLLLLLHNITYLSQKVKHWSTSIYKSCSNELTDAVTQTIYSKATYNVDLATDSSQQSAETSVVSFFVLRINLLTSQTLNMLYHGIVGEAKSSQHCQKAFLKDAERSYTGKLQDSWQSSSKVWDKAYNFYTTHCSAFIANAMCQI